MVENRSLRFGWKVDVRKAVFANGEYSLPDLLHTAALAEEAGFDYVAVGDSVLAKPRFSPIPVLAAIAGRTSRIELTTSIFQPHLRNLVTLAQEWATLDHASGGRTSLAVGLGTGPIDGVNAELANAGIHRRNRARAFEESIILLKKFWEGGPVTFHGKVYDFDRVDVGFTPVEPGGPPILVACGAYIPLTPGVGPNDVWKPEYAGKFIGPFERVARLGDGWMTGLCTAGEYREAWEKIRAAGEEQGRKIDPKTFERRLNSSIHVSLDGKGLSSEDRDAFHEAYSNRPADPNERSNSSSFSGTPERCVERISEFADAGVNSFQFSVGPEDPDRQMELVAEKVIPLLATVKAAD